MSPYRFAARALFVLALVSSTQNACVGPTLIVEKYSGPKRPAEQIAILRFYGNDPVLLVAVDGERADVRLAEDVRLHIEVLPGRHRVGVVPQSDMQGALRNASFEASAGKVYRFVIASDGGARVYEVDAESDALIRDVTLREEDRPSLAPIMPSITPIAPDAGPSPESTDAAAAGDPDAG